MFTDKVFSANARAKSEDLTALAAFVTLEDLEKARECERRHRLERVIEREYDNEF